MVKEYTHASARLTVSGVPPDMTISYSSGLGRDALILLAIKVLIIVAVILLSPSLVGYYVRPALLSFAVVMFYRTLAFTLDRTTIRAVGERLTVRHGPLPWLRGLDLTAAEVGRLFYAKRPGISGVVGAALRDGRRVALLSGVLRTGEAETVLNALRGWLGAAGGREDLPNEESRRTASAAARPAQAAPLSEVAFTHGPDGPKIVYKWAQGRMWVLWIICWLGFEIALASTLLHEAGSWVDVNLIDYPYFLIASLWLSYVAALLIFNKTTTRITDTAISVHRGPVPCFWPGDYDGPIEDVRQVCCSCHDIRSASGHRVCYVYVIVVAGTRLDLSTVREEYPDSSGRQFNLFTVRDDDLAFEWGEQVLAWIDERRRKRLGPRHPLGERPRVLETWWSPPDRARRLKIAFSFLAVFCGVAALIAGAEYLASSYRPARRGRRHEEIYRQFLGPLRTQENHAVVVPSDWQRGPGGFWEPLDVVYRNQPISLYRGMKEAFVDRTGGRIEFKGQDAALVEHTPCGRGFFLIFPLGRTALTQGAQGTVSADTPARQDVRRLSTKGSR
jgi:hypothetical protein